MWKVDWNGKTVHQELDRFFSLSRLREAYHYPAQSRRLFIEMNIIAKAGLPNCNRSDQLWTDVYSWNYSVTAPQSEVDVPGQSCSVCGTARRRAALTNCKLMSWSHCCDCGTDSTSHQAKSRSELPIKFNKACVQKWGGFVLLGPIAKTPEENRTTFFGGVPLCAASFHVPLTTTVFRVAVRPCEHVRGDFEASLLQGERRKHITPSHIITIIYIHLYHLYPFYRHTHTYISYIHLILHLSFSLL